MRSPCPCWERRPRSGCCCRWSAGIAPVIRGTRITTHQALNDVGIGGAAYGRSLVERLLDRVQRVRRIQRPVLLAVRNTLRHKGRLVQTLIVLVFGTALFISVLSVRASVNATLDSFMRFHRYDVSVQMEHPDLVTRLEEAASRSALMSARSRCGRAGVRPACGPTTARAIRSAWLPFRPTPG